MLQPRFPEQFDKSAPLAERIRLFRESKGLTRAALAQEIGVTSITLYRWETGSTRPSPLAAERLTGMGFDEVLERETNTGSIPRIGQRALSKTRASSVFQSRADELKKDARKNFDTQNGSISVLPSAFVRNGPPDQEPFHHKLLALQISADRSRDWSQVGRRLSLVESIDGLGQTAQHLLEKPKATSVSWNSNYGSHGWHRYVGRFPPHVVRALLNHFGAGPESVVCDPFAGSGTTAVECRLLGIPFVGIEICPLSCLITRTKSAFPEKPEILANLSQSFSQFHQEQTSKFLKGRSAHKLDVKSILARPGNPIPAFTNIERWFTPEALLGTSIAVEYGLSLEGFRRDAVLLALSSKMRSIGNVDVDVVRAEYSKRPRVDVDVGKLVTQRLARMGGDINLSVRSHSGMLGKASSIKLFEGSVLDVDLPEASIGHVITSPPYGVEALSYLRTHLLSYRSLVAFLKHDPYETREKTIGSEYLSGATAKTSHIAERVSAECGSFFAATHGSLDAKYESRRTGMMQFFDDMYEVGKKLSHWVKDDGNVAFIVGNKRLGDDVIPTDVIVRELFEACDFSFVEALKHKLKTNNSNSQVPWQERIIQEESILLFRRNRRRR
jgi:transcriptional regulator with XRE-family HTH domain